MVLLARKDEEGNTQALYDHLHGAGRLASGFEDEFADISRTAAVLHDVGKVAQQFQTYLLSDDGHRGDVQHARQGAFVVNDFFESKGEIEEIAKEILELAISKHHGGLPDCIDESGNRAFLLGFTESDKSNEKYAYQEIKRGLNGLALDLQSNFRGSAEDIACFLKKIKSLRLSKDSIYFYLGLLVKLIYSRLVDADRTDAACFETRKQYRPNAVDWQNLISRLDKSMRSFDSSSEINRIRHQINEQCCLAGARETGIYRLSIPTGGGKTLASLNFALHHALKTGKRRIIYVIPYLSITTQTAKTFRDVLGLNSDSDVLLEHYSTAGMQRSADVADNASSEFEDAGEHQRKLAAERWDNPIIVTTMVEFLETVMSARGTKLRKFHNMADSVIIFDEIQSLPMNTINLFNEIVSFLSKITNSTILLCSATQPLLEKTKRENLLLSEKPDLIAETESYEDKLRRTRIVASAENKSCDELGQIIYQQARKNGNCLAIVNLKKEAREIFQCLERLDVNHEFELIHLSTAMCGRHRTDCLNRIGALLDPGNPKPVICVSTQLIEAGVDISFACVVRAMAGLDSIMQAAGRCNRNGESVEPKNVYVYPLKDEDSMERYLPDIAMGKQLTLQIMENYPGKDLLSSNILEQYYDMLLRKKDGNGKGGYTDCPIRGRAEGATTAYDLLSFNECDRSQFTNTTGGKYGLCFAQAFQTVSDNFHVIPDVTHNVVVPYGQATELLDMLHRGELSEKISVLRRLQEYTVSLFDDDYHDLARKHAISLANEDFGVFLVIIRVDSSPISKEYAIMAALENKIDFAIAFAVNNANPNGDPLNGNRPRTTSEGLGEVSDVALKRKIRNRLQDAGESVFVQSDDRSDDGAKSLSDRFNTYLKTLPKDEQKQKNVVFGKVCERWLDVRSFGQVFAFKKAKDTDEVSIGVRGPVSIQPAFSINPIAIDDVQITKSVNSETTDSGKKSSDTMGMKYRVSGRAVYVTYGSISPQLAERTGFSAEDAEKIKEALVTLFENDESSARPSGSMEVLDVVWFAHNCKGGQYSSAKVHRSVSVDADGTVNVDDASIPGLRYEVIEGR